VSCPSCRADRVVRVTYGLPTEKTRERAARGEVVLGGCVVPADPEWAPVSRVVTAGRIRTQTLSIPGAADTAGSSLMSADPKNPE
jgi:hypothetical protein